MNVDELGLDPDLLAALRHLGARERARPQPLCPRCGHRPQSTPDGWCAACLDERHEAEKAAKRRWWAKNGPEWRAARQAATAEEQSAVAARGTGGSKPITHRRAKGAS